QQFNGSTTVSPTQTTSYEYTCLDSSGNLQNASVTVTVGSTGPLACPTPPCNSSGPGVSISSFTINNGPNLPPFHSTSPLACIEANGGTGAHLSWDAVDTNKCPAAPIRQTPPSLSSDEQFVGWTGNWNLTSIPPAATCQISSNPSGTSYSNLSSYSSVNAPAPSQSTDYALECTRKQYTCAYTRGYSYEEKEYGVGSNGEKIWWWSSPISHPPVTIQGQQTVIPQSSQTKYNTLIVIQPPEMTSFSPLRSNILVHQSTTLNWSYTTPPSTTNFQTDVPTDQTCYSGGGEGYLNDWQATEKNPFSGASAPVSPLYSTTYYLTCRNTYRREIGCYAETKYPAPNTSATVNVFNTNLQETGTGSFLLSVSKLLGDISGMFSGR
ncbi:MAG: hypothetical protein KGI71_03880, partial [Patescibacteria group bacterium]|nr:hypothetical protein [Patescibacteria group bacterium]